MPNQCGSNLVVDGLEIAMELFPAIDIRDGRCVRLVQGDYARETVYGEDPVEVARMFFDAGVTWIHVVDLDAARSGEPVNRTVVAAIAELASAQNISVQTGGGVRTVDAAVALFDVGVTRVVVGTAAVERPQVVADIAASGRGAVAVGLDAHAHPDGGYEVAVHGWTAGSGLDLFTVLARLENAGAQAVVATEIGRDGMLTGPDLGLYRALRIRTSLRVVASGGVSSLDDLRALVGVGGLEGAIAGKAIYERRFSVAEAVEACRGGPVQT